MYYTYMLRCKDESIYTGITTNVERRMKEHFSKDKKCAKYTLTHSAKKLEAVWETNDRALASKLEYQIKHLEKKDKEKLIENLKLVEVLENKIECDKYTIYKTN